MQEMPLVGAMSWFFMAKEASNSSSISDGEHYSQPVWPSTGGLSNQSPHCKIFSCISIPTTHNYTMIKPWVANHCVGNTVATLHHCLNSRCCFSSSLRPSDCISNLRHIRTSLVAVKKITGFLRAFLGISHTQKSEWQSGLFLFKW